MPRHVWLCTWWQWYEGWWLLWTYFIFYTVQEFHVFFPKHGNEKKNTPSYTIWCLRFKILYFLEMKNTFVEHCFDSKYAQFCISIYDFRYGLLCLSILSPFFYSTLFVENFLETLFCFPFVFCGGIENVALRII